MNTERWTIDGDTLTITLDGATAGTYSGYVPAPYEHPQAGQVIRVGDKDGKPVLVRLATRPELAAAIAVWAKAKRQHELATECHCERCLAHVDGRSAYRQQEWTRLGGARVKVTTYYCESCSLLLNAIGRGERSAMQERAAVVPPYEPTTKED